MTENMFLRSDWLNLWKTFAPKEIYFGLRGFTMLLIKSQQPIISVFFEQDYRDSFKHQAVSIEITSDLFLFLGRLAPLENLCRKCPSISSFSFHLPENSVKSNQCFEQKSSIPFFPRERFLFP